MKGGLLGKAISAAVALVVGVLVYRTVRNWFSSR